MRSSTSNSELSFVAAFALTVLLLLAGWETILRRRAGAPRELAIERPALVAEPVRGERWVLFGNCLVMTGISPRRLEDQLGGDGARSIVNIASHEQSPLAFFRYLRESDTYPDVVIANVSSWINGTNFDQEAALVLKDDPLRLATTSKEAGAGGDGAANADHRTASMLERPQKRAEDALARAASMHVRAVGRRYHLFDFSLFASTLATSFDLDAALYQLNVQPWFAVTDSETDGFGFVGLHVRYREDWPTGVERMAERSLQRLRLSNLLTPVYWSQLEDAVRDFRSRGKAVVLVRMPEHPRIRAFNDESYRVTEHLREIEQRTGAAVFDMSHLGPAEGVRLFDAVHPDSEAATVITREIATWLRSHHAILDGKHGQRGGDGG